MRTTDVRIGSRDHSTLATHVVSHSSCQVAKLFSQQDLLLLKSFEGGFNILLDYDFFGFLEYIWTLAGHRYTQDIPVYWDGLSLCDLQENNLDFFNLEAESSPGSHVLMLNVSNC